MPKKNYWEKFDFPFSLNKINRENGSGIILSQYIKLQKVLLYDVHWEIGFYIFLNLFCTNTILLLG